jgi:nicotinamide riboside transporter PnuC
MLSVPTFAFILLSSCYVLSVKSLDILLIICSWLCQILQILRTDRWSVVGIIFVLSFLLWNLCCTHFEDFTYRLCTIMAVHTVRTWVPDRH